MSFERWNALVEQVTRKKEQTPPPTPQEDNESEVEQVEQKGKENTEIFIQ